MKVECPRCRGKIDARATRCQHCQADFTPQEIATISGAAKSRSTGCLIALVILAGLVVIGKLAPSSPETSTNATDQPSPTKLASSASPTPTVPAGDVPKWRYSVTTDEVRNGKVMVANLTSENTTTLDFPYGTIHLGITVRQHPQWGTDVIFQADEGQILCSYSDCSGMLNIDGRSERLSLVESADHDSKVVFARYGSAILKKLKGSKKVIVELPFYSNGNRQFTFDTKGLEWPPKD